MFSSLTNEVPRCVVVFGLEQPEEQLVIGDARDWNLSCPARGYVESNIRKRMDSEACDVGVESRCKKLRCCCCGPWQRKELYEPSQR